MEDEMIKVCYISNEGGGFVRPHTIRNGTTVGEFVRGAGGGESLAGLLITVETLPAEISQVLKDGDTISATPVNVSGS